MPKQPNKDRGAGLTWDEYMKRQNSYAQSFPQHIGNLVDDKPKCDHEWTTEDSSDGPYTFCVHCGLGGRD